MNLGRAIREPVQGPPQLAGRQQDWPGFQNVRPPAQRLLFLLAWKRTASVLERARRC